MSVRRSGSPTPSPLCVPPVPMPWWRSGRTPRSRRWPRAECRCCAGAGPRPSPWWRAGPVPGGRRLGGVLPRCRGAAGRPAHVPVPAQPVLARRGASRGRPGRSLAVPGAVGTARHRRGRGTGRPLARRRTGRTGGRTPGAGMPARARRARRADRRPRGGGHARPRPPRRAGGGAGARWTGCCPCSPPALDAAAGTPSSPRPSATPGSTRRAAARDRPGSAVAVAADDEAADPWQAQVRGLGRVLCLEAPHRWGGLVDLPAEPDERAVARLCSVLADPAPRTRSPCGAAGPLGGGWSGRTGSPGGGWRPAGTVLITGGTGASWAGTARWAALLRRRPGGAGRPARTRRQGAARTRRRTGRVGPAGGVAGQRRGRPGRARRPARQDRRRRPAA